MKVPSVNAREFATGKRRTGVPPLPPEPGTCNRWMRETWACTRTCAALGKAREGVALVVTLILLSVITFLAVTFLVVSRSEHNAVATKTDQILAQNAAETGLANGIARTMAGILASSNPNAYDLMVSTNFYNTNGYDPSLPSGTLTNVNFDYRVGNTALQPGDFSAIVANLFYDPRVPVFLTNQLAHTNFWPFYYDINRSGTFDQTGLFPATNILGLPIQNPTNASMYLSNYLTGDPQWIGILERPDFPHSASNQFIGRYAYFIVPSGKTLDVNYSYNYARSLSPTMTPGADSFCRDQGVGTWELNLAAFLADLNTNAWNPPAGWNSQNNPYRYSTNNFPNALNSSANRGVAFDDALNLLRYRYCSQAGSYYRGTVLVSNVLSMLGTPATKAFLSDGVDDFSAGPLTLGPTPPLNPENGDNTMISRNYPWAGADNPNHFFSIQDFFDKSKTAYGSTGSNDLTDHILQAQGHLDSYDQSTFFRMMAQLGTDSSTPSPKMNLNYDNVSVTNTTTNFNSWTAINFFSNAVIRLLTDAGYTTGTNAYNLLQVTSPGVTNLMIQVWPTNLYTPSVHRLLQLAANIYDASTNHTQLPGAGAYPYVPTVFMPNFYQNPKNRSVYIQGYSEVTNTALQIFGAHWDDFNIVATNQTPPRLLPGDMIYGVPLVIGAKKGWPNFQQCAVQTRIDLTRALFFQTNLSLPNANKINQTNQIYFLTNVVSATVGLWNSYSNAFPRRLQLQVFLDVRVRMTNELGNDLLQGGNRGFTFSNFTSVASTPTPAPAYIEPLAWGGFTNTPSPNIHISMTNFLTTNFFVLSNAQYSVVQHRFVTIGSKPDSENSILIPQLWYLQNTRLRMYLMDLATQRIVDFVNVDSTPNDSFTNLTYEASLENAFSGPVYGLNAPYTQMGDGPGMWATNRLGASVWSPTYGIQNQIMLGLGNTAISRNYVGGDTTKQRSCNGFCALFGLGAPYPGVPAIPAINGQEWYAATRTIYYYIDWQANDPLVHYTIGDLGSGYPSINGVVYTNHYELDTATHSPMTNSPLNNRGRYEPWAINQFVAGKQVKAPASTASNPAVKDPMITCSDAWNFPTNKYPNVGWLGRVHRGTPWQTVYLKSALPDPTAWQSWSGDQLNVVNFGQFPTNLPVPPPRYPAGRLVAFTTNIYTEDSYFSMPTNDYRLLDMFSAAPDDNAARGQLSVNQTNFAAWSAVLSGVVIPRDGSGTNWTVVQPAAVDQSTTNNPPLLQIYNAINAARTTPIIYASPGGGFLTNLPPVNGVYSRVGDILRVPQLTLNSPYINQTGSNLNDAVYEWIPQQILGLLKCDQTPRFTIYSYGQALKPATHGFVVNGTYAGLVTNYQVTAEMATRAVVRIDGAATNAHAVIEQFNVLPPE